MRYIVLTTAFCLLAACGKPPGNVDTGRVRNADSEPGQWLSLGRNWQGDRFSPLKKITVDNAATLGFAWEYEVRTRRGRVEHGQEATPLVIDGVIYASGPWGSAIAVDAKTGKQRWRYDPEVDGSFNRKACCDAVSRGLQVWKGKVYVATLDGHLVSLDAKTGRELWKVDTLIERDIRSYTITGPPQVAKNVVVIGNSGAEFGVRGYVTAYDLETGKQKWRFYTVPGDPAKGPPEHPELEMALKTWDPKSDWASGLGGTVWGEMNYDPELNLLYVGTGNASPEAPWVRSPSGGDNLFLASILAINPDDGKLAWYYQTTPSEMWDFTATQNMILADLELGGKTRKVLMQAPKNGYFYVLDRATGEFLSAKPYVFTNWASSVDAKGKFTLNPAAMYQDQPALVFPTGAGGHNWPPMAFNPETKLVYIPARESGMVLTPSPGKNYKWKPGQANSDHRAVFSFFVNLMGPEERKHYDAVVASHPDLPSPATREFLMAYDPVAQQEKWRLPLGTAEFAGGGVLTTAGNLVVQGTYGGKLIVYRADTGEKVKEIETGTAIVAAPVSYELDGEQYIAVLAGFGGALAPLYPTEGVMYKYQNYGRLLAFKLGGGATPLPPKRVPQQTPEPPVLAGATPEMEMRGAMLFGRCATCHGARGEARLAAYPDLFRLSPETHAIFKDIVLGGRLSANGMASFADALTEQDVEALHAFLVREQRKLREEELAAAAK